MEKVETGARAGRIEEGLYMYVPEPCISLPQVSDPLRLDTAVDLQFIEECYSNELGTR